ncbi:MAG: hypothetical protein K0Q49_1670 [Haloplasmataceae bacterium]|jgi:uncharacterized protein YunC (DUF1805 family)|nr:hypothetical protein [Haloplasmataceae bacterium]
MFRVDRIYVNNKTFFTYNIKLPKTTLLIIANDIGYFSCRAIDIDVFDAKPHLKERKVVCGCAEGVKTIEELLNAPLVKVSAAAKELGITEGMLVIEALNKLE